MSNLPHFFLQDIPFFSSHHSIIFFAITLPFIFSLFCAATISKIGHRLALIDNPNIRSSHSLPTPRGGGIGIWLAFVIIGLFFFKDNAFTLIAGHFFLIQVLKQDLVIKF
jgi:UDP-N-acetylmuramyl pentapeptide phosphotransferase/UDP-N-acetylglucosamine-1-phosphate transferase